MLIYIYKGGNFLSNCTGFLPIVNTDAKILILGSMPSVASLAQNQYYAHLRNRFWPLMADLLQYVQPKNYEEKKHMLLTNNIALWDSLAACERNGSLDSAIKNEVSNDFVTFLNKYKSIRAICFNGGKSYQAFKKYNQHILDDKRYSFYRLPSTSPANARFTMDKLKNKWEAILQEL